MKNPIRHCLFYFFLPFFIVLLIPMLSFAQTVSGEITGAETWTGTVVLTGDVTIAKTGKVIVTPGTQILFSPASDDKNAGTDSGRIELIVAGTLIAEGTGGQIVFTSASNKPAPGDWSGIQITGSVSFSNCLIEYADTGISVNSMMADILQSTIQNNQNAGISLAKESSISNCIFQNNGTEGITTTEKITVKNCTFSSNKTRGLTGQSDVYVEGCTFKENAAGGIWAMKIRFKDSISESNYGDGITCQTDATIIKSQIFSNKGDGVYAPNGKVNSSDSSYHDNGSNGVYSTALTALTNNFYRNGQSGISIKSVDSAGIKGNVFTENVIGVKIRSTADSLDFPGGNDIFSNTSYELANGNRASIISKGNYWGDSVTADLKNKVSNITKIFDALDNTMVGPVTISDYSAARLTSFVPPAASPTPTITPSPTLTPAGTPSPGTPTPSPVPGTTNTPTFTPTATIKGTPTSQLSPTATPTPSPSPLPGMIVSGETRYGEIIEVAQDEIFRFIGVQNQIASMLVSKITGTINPQLELHDPGGDSMMITQVTDSVFTASLRLPETGVYTIRCRDQKGINTGKFGLSLLLFPGQVLSAQDMDGGQIHSGEVKSGFLEIADLDAFTFDATIGNTVFILMAKNAGDIQPAMTLLDPNGNPLQSINGIDSTEISNFHLPVSGTYLIVCRDTAGIHSGKFSLSLRVIDSGNTCTRGDMNNDGTITPGDTQAAFTLFAEITEGKKKSSPPFLYCDEFWRGDYNQDATITPGDAQSIFEHFLNSLRNTEIAGKLNHQKKAAAIDSLSIQAGSITADASDLITIPVYCKTTRNLSAFSFSLHYDPLLLEYVDMQKNGTLVEPFVSLAAVSLNGKVAVSGFAGSATLDITRNILVNLLFRIRPSAPNTITEIIPGDFMDDFYGAESLRGKITIHSPLPLEHIIQIGNIAGQKNHEVIIPITVYNPGYIRSFAFDVETDASALTFKSILRKNTLTEIFFAADAISNTRGGITVAGFLGGNSLTPGDGILLNLVYAINNVEIGEIPVTITNLIDDLSGYHVKSGGVSMLTPVGDWPLF